MVQCNCGVEAAHKQAGESSKMAGKWYYACQKGKPEFGGCGFFQVEGGFGKRNFQQYQQQQQQPPAQQYPRQNQTTGGSGQPGNSYAATSTPSATSANNAPQDMSTALLVDKVKRDSDLVKQVIQQNTEAHKQLTQAIQELSMWMRKGLEQQPTNIPPPMTPPPLNFDDFIPNSQQ